MAERVGGIVGRDAGIASLAQRGVGAVIDGFVIGLVTLVLEGLRLPITPSSLWRVALSALYVIPQIAQSGKTVGCRAVGIHIAAEPGGSVPGWTRSAARWAPQTALLLLVRFVIPGHSALTFAFLVLLVLYVPALFDARRRSIPDRVAGTVVRVTAAPSIHW